jgi:hypothetical protein
MPATLMENPLGISCMFSDGRSGEFILADVANPQLARDLLVGLAELVHPHGTVDAAGSVRHYVRAVRGMATTLAERGFAAGAAGLGEDNWPSTDGDRRGTGGVPGGCCWASPR